MPNNTNKERNKIILCPFIKLKTFNYKAYNNNKEYHVTAESVKFGVCITDRCMAYKGDKCSLV